MTEATEIILNPGGNHHRDGRHWITRQREILRQLAPAEVTIVESGEEATQAARQSAMKGYRKIVSVGDESTAHGVINGVMELAESHRRILKIGFLSLGRPDVWSRTLRLPRGLSRQLEILAAGHTLPFDVGRVKFQGGEGNSITRHFVNGASFGLAGQLRSEWRKPDGNLIDFLPRGAGILRNAFSGQGPLVRIEAEGSTLHQGPCTLTVVMGGRYYPAFGQIAPQADPADGLLDLAWLECETPWEVLLKLASVWLSPLRFKGDSMVRRSVEEVKVTALNESVHLELDGQPAGRLPAHFSVVPKTLPVIVAPVAAKLRKPKRVPVEKIRNGRLAGNIKSAAGM